MRSIKQRSLRTLLVTVFAALSATRAEAQRVCLPVEPGDSAARLAASLTGDPANRHAPWFEIVDERWRPIPKHAYHVVLPGWLACVPHARPILAGSLRSPQRPQLREASTTEPLLLAVAPFADPGFLVIAGILVLGLTLSRLVIRSRRRRRIVATGLRRFGEAFVREFARPLVGFRGANVPPRARLRIRPRRARVEVLLAPPAGGTYPNLADHRRNVEYDVARVVSVLAQQAFVGRRPYSEGGWVVLPFDYTGTINQGGGR